LRPAAVPAQDYSRDGCRFPLSADVGRRLHRLPNGRRRSGRSRPAAGLAGQHRHGMGGPRRPDAPHRARLLRPSHSPRPPRDRALES